jgi:hypothetical protein
MALNQIERAILIAARLYVADGREPRICHAISRSAELVGLGRTTNQVEKVREAATRLRRLIIGEIKVGGEPVFSLEDWICDKLPGSSMNRGPSTTAARSRCWMAKWSSSASATARKAGRARPTPFAGNTLPPSQPCIANGQPNTTA